jgi:hypothetical protein
MSLFQDVELEHALQKAGFFIAKIDIDPIFDKEDLFNSILLNCHCPYFGFNWDSVIDCLSDFSWEPAKGYMILYKDPSHLDESDLGVFLNVVLDEIVIRWKSRNIPFKLIVSKEAYKNLGIMLINNNTLPKPKN